MIRGVRVGLVRRTRFGARCEDAVETLFHALPPSESKRWIIVDAGIATQERFAAATDQDALLGRLRINNQQYVAGCPAPPERQAGPSDVARAGVASRRTGTGGRACRRVFDAQRQGGYPCATLERAPF